MKWVNGHRYDEFHYVNNEGKKDIFYAGLTHRCPNCNEAIISIPDEINIPEHDCGDDINE